MEIPVYLFTGFLESGKTKFISESLCDKRFNAGESTLLLLCEEGIEEYESEKYGKNVHIVNIENESDLTAEYLSALEKKHSAERVIIEYNGMWQSQSLFMNVPENWTVYQEVFFADSNTILSYNANMRSLVVDKLTTCEMAVFNRVPKDSDIMPFHKLVRALNTKCDIMYEHPDGSVQYDDIKDPPPYNRDGEIVVIEDKDYAIFYRDVMEDMSFWHNKTVQFKGVIAKDKSLPDKTAIIGRHVMTCCVDDIKYLGMVLVSEKAPSLNSYDWVNITAKIEIKFNKLYRGKGPVLSALEIVSAEKPTNPVATF